MGGSIQEDKRSKKLYIKFYIDGKQVTIYTDKFTNQPFKSKAHATKCMGIIQREIDDGIFDRNEWKKKKLKYGRAVNRFTVKQYCDSWLKKRNEMVVTGEIVPRTLKDEKTYVSKYINKKLGTKFLDQVNEKDIKQFYHQIPLSDASRYNIVSIFRTIMKKAKKAGVINGVPDFPKMRKKSKEPKKFMIPEIQNHVISKIPKKDQPIFHIMRQYGLRPSEARALKKESIRNGEINIEWSFSENLLRNTTKTDEKRSYLLTTFIESILADIPDSDSEFVFVRDDGKPYTSKNLNKIWREACKDAGIHHFKLYNAMRHSLARNLLQNRYNFDMVAEVLGHSDVATTKQFYADLPMNEVQDALDVLSQSQDWVGR